MRALLGRKAPDQSHSPNRAVVCWVNTPLFDLPFQQICRSGSSQALRFSQLLPSSSLLFLSRQHRVKRPNAAVSSRERAKASPRTAPLRCWAARSCTNRHVTCALSQGILATSGRDLAAGSFGRVTHGAEQDSGTVGRPADAHYSMISSARASTDDGILRPSAFTVFMLITTSNFVGCCTGKSPGRVPASILSMYSHACRN